MHRSVQALKRSLLPLAGLLALSLPAGAVAAPTAAELRVEAENKAIAPGNTYLTDTETITTDTRQPACGGTGQEKTVQGPTALGIVESASEVHEALRPFAVSDKFEFGLLVCGIGEFLASDDAFWLYKVDHVAPEVGGDQFAIRRGQQVLWYFQDTARNINTGDELELVAPARATPGDEFQVTVNSYNATGTRSPAADAVVVGPGFQVTTDGDGRATIPAEEGRLRLRAVRGADIPSAPVHVCVGANCPATLGERIFGTAGADRIRGTAGPDVVRSLRGADRVNVRGGGRDRVGCGAGGDVVIADRRDRVARDCERVRRR
jgi:hypothetical protein